ncbi:MAG: serine/threonine-protein kinase [Cyanobacteria bacterium P01_F01_bin.143]
MLHNVEELIIDRYKIIDFLGQGMSGETYKALDLQSNDYVALKVLSLQQMSNWKVMELFEREAKILAQIKHHAIPTHLNYFQMDFPQEKRWYLIQKLVLGQSLTTLVENNWKATEDEIVDIASQVLEILIYLHSLNPPVIHRDIKPQNIIRQSDGKIYLVDFGAVTDIYPQTLIGSSTVVGTYGYMAPEQFRGKSVPTTDLYGLGATLLYLLTYSSPADLPQKKLKIDFRSSVNVSTHLADWLEVMVEPIIEERFESASQALAVLKGEEKIHNWRNHTLRKPAHSKIELTKTRNKININIPHRKGDTRNFNHFLLFLSPLILVAFILFSPSNSPNELLTLIERIILTIPLGIITLYFFFNYLFSVLGYTQLEINYQNFCLQYCLFFYKRKIHGNTEDISEVKLAYDVLAGGMDNSFWASIVEKCLIVEGTKVHQFGRYITRIEKEWLTKEIAAFLDQ